MITITDLLFRRESDFLWAGCIFFVVSTAQEPSETANSAAEGRIFDEPSISRQWVARRLQRALTVERWGGPARTGLSRLGGEAGRLLLEHGQTAGKRAQTLESLIRDVGAEPYFSVGIGAPTTRFATALLGRTKAASQLEQGLDATRATALAQTYVTREAMKLTDNGLQIIGGHGYIRDYPVGMWYRNARTVTVLEGLAVL